MNEPTLYDIHATMIRLEERVARFMEAHAKHEQDCIDERVDHEKRLRELEGRTDLGVKVGVGAAATAIASAILAWVKGH